MATIADLKKWISEILPNKIFNDYVQTISDEEPDNDERQYIREITMKIFTKSLHYYHIVAKYTSNGEGYLGCQVGKDYHLAGVGHASGNDLPDGPLNEETWNKIVHAIIASELRELGT